MEELGTGGRGDQVSGTSSHAPSAAEHPGALCRPPRQDRPAGKARQDRADAGSRADRQGRGQRRRRERRRHGAGRPYGQDRARRTDRQDRATGVDRQNRPLDPMLHSEPEDPNEGRQADRNLHPNTLPAASSPAFPSRPPPRNAPRPHTICPVGGMSERCMPCPGREGSSSESGRRVGIRRGWLEETQDKKSWFPAQFLVVLGVAFAHCIGWDRLDEFFDEEPSISGRRAQG
jgi:hypothetical protein